MSKGKLYKIDKKYENNSKSDTISFIVGIIVYACVLVISSYLFKGIYVSNFGYALLAALILSVLNYTIKPVLIYWTLPLSVVTFGIAYPISNMIILKLCDVIMGSSFEVTGFFRIFFIAIFISGLKMLLDAMITNRIKEL